jgi:sulfonate transport system permease protein
MSQATGLLRNASRAAARQSWPVLRVKHLRGAILPVALLVLWQFASSRQLVSSLVLPSPGAVLAALYRLAVTGVLADALEASLARLVQAYAAGLAIGLGLGILLGTSRLARRLIAPSFYAIAMVPLLAWIPFLMLIFGIGEALKLVLVAKAALTPITLNTARGIGAIPPQWRELGRLYGLDTITTLRRILLPASILPIFTGLRLGLVQAWAALVAVELLAASRGLGYELTMTRQLFRLDEMMALMLVIGLIGFVLDRGLLLAEQKLVRRFGGGA